METTKISLGKGYFTIDVGRFDAGLVFVDTVVARTDYDRVIAYNSYHKRAIEMFAGMYDMEIEWRD